MATKKTTKTVTKKPTTQEEKVEQLSSIAQSSTSTPRRRKRGGMIAVTVLSALLLISIAVGGTLAYFLANASASGTITLGNPVNINITQVGSSASSLTFPGNALPGTVYDQAIGVSQPDDTSDSLVRAKLTITNTDGASKTVKATTVNTWQKGDSDDYYYYKGTFTAGSSQDFVTSITVPTDLTNNDAKKSFSVEVVVEAIQKANGAASEVWTTAPEDWLSNYANA